MSVSKSRQRKLVCGECGFIAYASAGAVIACGLPVCGCGSPMLVANPRDLAVIDPEGFDELAGLMPSRGAYNRLMRESGFDGMILRNPGDDPAVARRRAARMKRCTSEGCGRFAAKGTSRCAQHAEVAMPF